MKRILAILLACILTASLLAACGASKSKMEAFYVKYGHLEMVIGDTSFDLYKDGKGRDAEDYGWGRYVWDGDTCYMIDYENKTVQVSVDEYFPEDIYIDVGGMRLTGSGKGMFGGALLDSETFEDEDWKQTYYFDGNGGLKGYVVVDKEEPEEVYKSLEVLSYDNNIPKGVFDVPADYEVIEGAVG